MVPDNPEDIRVARLHLTFLSVSPNWRLAPFLGSKLDGFDGEPGSHRPLSPAKRQ